MNKIRKRNNNNLIQKAFKNRIFKKNNSKKVAKILKKTSKLIKAFPLI